MYGKKITDAAKRHLPVGEFAMAHA